jgi:hypothetical protein
MSIRTRSLMLAILCFGQAIAGVSRAAEVSEFWPELQGFYRLNPDARIFLNAAYAKGKESDEGSMDIAAYLDYSFVPIVLARLRTDDWQRSRSFWGRIGYDRIFKTTDDSGAEVAEDRGIISFYGKAPLPAEVWLEGRVRADLRWIGDDYSTRYRARLEATREFDVKGHPVVPYLNYEWFYDTRYDAWARTLAQAGVEVTVTKRFRLEAYFAGQHDSEPSDDSLGAFGIVAKWYYER